MSTDKTTAHTQATLSAIGLDRFIAHYLLEKHEDIEFTVEKLRNTYPDLTDVQLAKKLRDRMARRNGAYGMLSGVGEMSTLPLTVPFSMVTSWKIQVKLIACIAYLFGKDSDPETLRNDIYLLLARQAFNSVGKGIGLQAAKVILQAQIRRQLVRLQMKMEQKQMDDAGKKLPDLTKVAVLAGAPLGFIYDFTSTRRIGTLAIRYYKKA